MPTWHRGDDMNVIYRRVRLGLSAVMVAGAFIVALVPFTAAQAAATPFHFKFTSPDSFTDDSCGFPVDVNVQDSGVVTVFFDAQGNPQSATVETNTVGTNSANGITLRVTGHYVDFFNFSTGYDKETGLPIHVQDGGVVIRDAGYLLFNPDGSVAVIHGPHPQLEGDIAGYCAALS